MDGLTTLREWVKSGNGKRTVETKIGEFEDLYFMNIWAYDFELAEGQFVNSVKEIDLKKKKQDDERKLYEKLKTKFEGAL
jgi:hypothetical protein